MNQNRKAFLSAIAKAEGTYGRGDDGYNVLVGGLFSGIGGAMKKIIFGLLIITIATMSISEIQKIDNLIKWEMVKIVKELNEVRLL